MAPLTPLDLLLGHRQIDLLTLTNDSDYVLELKRTGSTNLVNFRQSGHCPSNFCFGENPGQGKRVRKTAFLMNFGLCDHLAKSLAYGKPIMQ